MKFSLSLLLLVGVNFVFPPEKSIAQNVVVQQPTFGVSIDADGVLTSKKFPGGVDLVMRRVAAAKAMLAKEMFDASKTRYVSLRKLDEAIAERLKNGKQPTDEMLNLAGLLRVEFVFSFPDEKDIVIAGPAEGWIESPAGHNVGVRSGLPVLQLQDLATALAVFSKDRPVDQWVGCSIGPSGNAIKKLQAFNRTIPRSIPTGQEAIVADKILKGTIESLGMASVVTFGIQSKTHMGKRMIEADYRMKMIGIGAEAPPIKMQTFYNQIKSPPKEVLQRWWLVPDYDRVGISKSGFDVHFVGAGVKLLTENYERNPKGGLRASKRKPSFASTAYSKSFTKNFEKIALLSSCFGQLRNSIDLLVAAAFMRSKNCFDKVGWHPNTLTGKGIKFEEQEKITNAPCLINSKWNGRRFFTLAGGGVSITPSGALKPEHLKTIPAKMFDDHKPAKIKNDSWWWDSK